MALHQDIWCTMFKSKTVSTIKCPLCNDIIYSNNQLDTVYCKCGAIYIEGGPELVRFGVCSDDISIHDLIINKVQLYEDEGDAENVC